MNKERQAQLDGLHQLLDWLDEHDGVRIPYWLTVDHDVHARDETQLLALRRLLGGNVEKVVTRELFGFSRTFGPTLLRVVVPRSNVCERKVVGTEDVPAVPAHTREIVEWVCPESFLVKLGEHVA